MRRICSVAFTFATAMLRDNPLPGQFVYFANCGSANVPVYAIQLSTGALAPITGSPFAAGSFPNSAAVDRVGKFVYLANKKMLTVLLPHDKGNPKQGGEGAFYLEDYFNAESQC